MSKIIPYTEQAFRLLFEGAQTLAQIECNGLHIDTDYVDRAIERVQNKIKRLLAELETHKDILGVWKKKYKGKTNFNSNEQLGSIMFEVLGFSSPEKTESGQWKTDEETLNKIDHPFVKDYLEIKKLKTTLSVNLRGLKREVVDGYLYPFFLLNSARTYRSSSEAINFQNIPIRDPAKARIVRRAFIPRPGRRLVENDYSGIEVRVAACLHKDPRMIEYIKDKTKDMHRDMAMKCYMLAQQEVSKNVRYCGKNMFVFPQFYGDWYIDCARSLWEAIEKMKLITVSGISLRKHLKDKGITKLGRLDPREPPRLGTFEYHIQQVEKWFWEEMFPAYAKWRKDWVQLYKKRGWLLTPTGFICQGYMGKNEILNYPIQGPAFHCLLWSLIELHRAIQKRKMKTLLVGQIHDSIVADVPDEELDEYVDLSQEIMVNRLMKTWDWIIVPIEIETEATPVDGSWVTKKAYESKRKEGFRRLKPQTPEWREYWHRHPSEQDAMIAFRKENFA